MQLDNCRRINHGGWTGEARASEWCDKQVKFDPDLWIVEVEDREGRAFVDEPIV